jgi:hypothetical protein
MIMKSQLTADQHIERGCALLADAATEGITPSAASSLAQRAAAHFLAARALGVTQGEHPIRLPEHFLVDSVIIDRRDLILGGHNDGIIGTEDAIKMLGEVAEQAARLGEVDVAGTAAAVESGTGFVRVRLAGERPDVAAALELFEVKHVHLDGVTSPRSRPGGGGVHVYGTLPIGEYLAHADKAEQAVPPAVEVPLADVGLVYRDRARVVAYLAALFPSVIAYNDEQVPDWPVIYVDTPQGQLSWHLATSDLDLFEHVELLPSGTEDHRAVWDGHSSDDKNGRLQNLVDEATRERRA